MLADYRETISDLLLETFTTEWSAWARRQGRLVRNQAHGSPASLLDLYAASDIPETEGAEIQRFKWAASAAHVAGRRLVSAEAATWLGEHFRVRLADVRAAVDRFFVAGINHIVYHGTAYSPVGDPWPGWQFYASVEFNPRNAWWDDFAALNAYVARVQSFMQSGRPDSRCSFVLPALRGAGRARKDAAGAFRRRGSTAARHDVREGGRDASGGRLHLRLRLGSASAPATGQRHRRSRARAGGSYRTIVLPSSRYVPVETVLEILELARQGATVVSYGGWPADVSGVSGLDGQSRALQGGDRRDRIRRRRRGRYSGSRRWQRPYPARQRSQPAPRPRERAARADGRPGLAVRAPDGRDGPRLLHQQPE